jgi:hypothetical protein
MENTKQIDDELSVAMGQPTAQTRPDSLQKWNAFGVNDIDVRRYRARNDY